MPARRYNIPGQARFLTFSCYRRLALLSAPQTRDALVELIETERAQLDMRIIAWVIMPEHIHMILFPQDGDVHLILNRIKQRFAKSMLGRWRDHKAHILPALVDSRGHTHFWQSGSGYDRNIRNHDELNEKINYIHMNPVRRGLVRLPAHWAWSSAKTYADSTGLIEIWRG